MIPSLEHLGHACTRFEYGGLVVTSDPWFNSAFLESWFPYPDNRRYMSRALDSNYVYISHAHEDHFDRKFLRQVDPCRTTLIIPDFRSKYLEREIRKLGFDDQFSPIVLQHGQSVTLPQGVKATMFIDRSHKEDSALLLETPAGFRYLNSNDCELAISDWPKYINVLACQFSGATWYPQCYDFDDETMARKSQEVRKSNFDRLCRRVRCTEAKAYLPFAGPAAFLAPETMKFNHEGSIFPVWDEIAPHFSREFPNVMQWPYLGDRTDFKTYQRAREHEWACWDTRPGDPVTEDELNAHFSQLQRLNKRFLKDWHKSVGVSSGTQHWNIRLGLVESVLEESFFPEYFMDVPPRVLRAVVDGWATWETALTSHRVGLHRDPDVYDLKLMGLLNFGDRPVQTLTMAKQQASDEMTTRNGVTFQRWCPHAGEDLNFATVENGTVKCPRHEWCWDSETGECLTGQGVPLKVRKN